MQFRHKDSQECRLRGKTAVQGTTVAMAVSGNNGGNAEIGLYC